MIIRRETANDYNPIRNVHIAAFANHTHSHQTEHLIVDALRASRTLTVSLVAEVDGNVVGHVAFSPVKINGIDCRWLGLGPVGVLPDFQRQGIGSSLIQEGLKTIRFMNADGCVLVGEPSFYSRFGFWQDPALTMEGVPPQYLLCLPMTGLVPTECVSHDPAFWVQG